MPSRPKPTIGFISTWPGVPGNGWDPTDPGSGNAWENQAFFDFNDQALPALHEFEP